MFNLGIAFTPLVPEYVVWAGFRRGRADLVPAADRAQPRRAGCAPSRMALMVLALANPSFTREDRDPIPSVAAVIVDKSPSQDFGDRNKQTAAGARRPDRSGSSASPAWKCAWPTPAQADGDNEGTQLFSALILDARRRAARPHRRRHHDHRRPRARRAGQCRRARLCRAAARADHRPRQRDRPPRRADRDAALRHRRPVADHRLPHRGPGRQYRRRRSDRAARRRGAGKARGHRAHRHQGQGADPACRAEHRGGRRLAARRRAHAGQQSRGGLDRRRARQAARALGLGRAACRRAHLAQSA